MALPLLCWMQQQSHCCITFCATVSRHHSYRLSPCELLYYVNRRSASSLEVLASLMVRGWRPDAGRRICRAAGGCVGSATPVLIAAADHCCNMCHCLAHGITDTGCSTVRCCSIWTRVLLLLWECISISNPILAGPTPAGALAEPQEDAAAPSPAPAASSPSPSGNGAVAEAPAAAGNGAAPETKPGGAITSAMVSTSLSNCPWVPIRCCMEVLTRPCSHAERP